MVTKIKERDEFVGRVIARAWKDEAYRSRLLDNPKKVLTEELGASVPDHVDVRVLEETPEVRYVVLPHMPAGLRPLTEAEIAAGKPKPVCPTVTSTAITSPCDCGARQGPAESDSD